MILIEMNSDNEITIRGYIIATDYNRHGKVLEIAVETEDFKQYIIDQNNKGKELRDCVYHQVVVTGILKNESNGNTPIIKITNYEVIQ